MDIHPIINNINMDIGINNINILMEDIIILHNNNITINNHIKIMASIKNLNLNLNNFNNNKTI